MGLSEAIGWPALALFTTISVVACTKRNPAICCDSTAECMRAGLDPSGGLAPCAEGVCVNFACVARDASVPDIDGPTSNLPECQAQRAVYLIGGYGGLAWFSLVWPAPKIITAFDLTYAYDDPALAASVSTDSSHPLFARKLGDRALWDGRGTFPQPSVFVAGNNEWSSATSVSVMTSGATALAGEGAALQASLQSKVPSLVFADTGPYGTVTGAPLPTAVADTDAAIHAFAGIIDAQQLAPSAAQLARYVPHGTGSPFGQVTFGNELAFTANALRNGLVSTVMIPVFPHGADTAFTGGGLSAQINDVAAALDAFYADLGEVNEPACSHLGKPISLADNTVLIVNGDTPGSPFNTANWPYGTPSNFNWIYVRSNGFTKPGWFGEILPTGSMWFDPNTGLSRISGDFGNTPAAYAGVLYAIARGDKARVQTVTTAPFAGIILN